MFKSRWLSWCFGSLIGALLATPSALAADAALIEAARGEGRVVWYTGFVIEQLARPLAEAFEAKYGVRVEYVRANSADLGFARFRCIRLGRRRGVRDELVGVFDQRRRSGLRWRQKEAQR